MAITSVSQIAYPINYQLMRQLLLTAKVRAPFLNGTMPGQLSKNAGTASVKWERIENLTADTTPLGELSGNLALPTRAGVVPTITPITADMLKYGKTIYLNEELELMSVNARASKFLGVLGENAGATYNKVMAAVYAGATKERFANSVASRLLVITAMTAGDIKATHNEINRLGGMKYHPEGYGSTNIGTSPIRSSYMGICHVDVEEDIREINDFVPVESYGGYTETYPFEFGYSQGVRWCSTEEDALIVADATTALTAGFRGTTKNDIYLSYVCAVDAIGSVGLGENHTTDLYMTGDRIPAVDVVYAPPAVSVADAQGEIGVLSWKGWLVGKVLNADWVVRIETLATDYSL